MRKYLWTLFAAILLTGTSCQEKIDIEIEKEAIKAVIQEERASFLDRDLSRVEATWVQESTSRKYYMNAGGITKIIGWTEVRKSDKKAIERDISDKYENLDAKYSNFEIIVYGNTALVFHDTQWSGKYQGEEINTVQARILHLEKVEGEWKLDLMAMYRIPDKEVKSETEDAD